VANYSEKAILSWYAKLWVALTTRSDRRGPVKRCIDVLKWNGSSHNWQHDEVRHWFAAMKKSAAEGTRQYPEQCPEEVLRYQAALGIVTPAPPVPAVSVDIIHPMGFRPRELDDACDLDRLLFPDDFADDAIWADADSFFADDFDMPHFVEANFLSETDLTPFGDGPGGFPRGRRAGGT
jgi:hypothetical protein